ncbi:YuzD family protein [Halobacillus litoralis]|uniref:YuzD family protein n=1 Tax=Halobacillus litoralis TaxID=45668 RepID=UPI001CD2C239|nr:YuzD family protein [Halobacillus litoralis]MCA0971777.1 YuzD family protein [Halobacillus litoralis]
MGERTIQVTVYGAEVKCASCVNAPGSKETYEWLQAAITRKYKDEQIRYQYIDIQNDTSQADEEILQQLLDDELFYPLVLVGDEIVAEGMTRLKSVYKALDAEGVPLREEA